MLASRQCLAALASFATIFSRHVIAITLDPVAVAAVIVVVIAPLLLRLVQLSASLASQRIS
jgi:hypothetical protein